MIHLSAAVPTIPAETFDNENFAIVVTIIALFAAGVLLVNSKNAIIGLAGVTVTLIGAGMAVLMAVDVDRHVDDKYTAIAEQVENQYDVTLDRDVIEDASGDGSLLTPVGRFDNDLTRLVYGSSHHGDVLLMVAQGDGFVALGDHDKTRDFDFGRVWPNPGYGDRRYPSAGDGLDIEPGSDVREFDAGH